MDSVSSFGLDNKTILITGASSGIGKSVAVECAKTGARLILTGTHKERLIQTLDACEQVGEPHEYRLVNLSTDEGIEELVGSLPILDGVVFSAGIGITKTVPFYNRADIQRVFDINFLAPVLTTKLLVKKKLLKKGSSLVYLCSVAGIHSFNTGNGIYGTSKSALHGFVKFAAKELASREIRCNCVCPAMVETPFISKSVLSEEDMLRDKERYAMKRYARPEEVARGCLFLLSEASSYMTGQDLILDGGRLLN